VLFLLFLADCFFYEDEHASWPANRTTFVLAKKFDQRLGFSWDAAELELFMGNSNQGYPDYLFSALFTKPVA
jgi:hypothetical protein